ncbi:ribosomal protein S18-alanine N-acetyltransferase [Marinobacter piscensis]|uniref:ribosomal protein S18-alanine N-acetyltransferase n=1 Tax=Marinobacter piscensis TaxID=1562308 RepID=UPI00319DC3D1
MALRPLSPDNIPDMLEIERLGHSHPWTEGIFSDCFKPGYLLSGAWFGERLVGYAVVAYMFDEAHLLNICVHPDTRGHGVGRQLLRHVIQSARSEDMSEVLLEVRISNKAASKLYQKEGFEEIGRRPGYYPAASGREDARVMSLLLYP